MEERIDVMEGGFWGRNPHEELAWLRAKARLPEPPGPCRVVTSKVRLPGCPRC
jgi:hypothetical protein